MHTIHLTDSSMKGFNHVWQQLLIIKVKVLYEIAQNKKCSFRELIDEFIPEAIENRELWEKDYLLDENFFGKHINKQKERKTAEQIQKKIDFVNDLTSDVSPKKKKRKKIVIKKGSKNVSNTKKKIIIKKRNP